MSMRYELSHAEIATVRKAAGIMNLGWRAIAARPKQALRLIDCIKQARDKRAGSCWAMPASELNPSVADYKAGCDRWADSADDAIEAAKRLLKRWRDEA